MATVNLVSRHVGTVSDIVAVHQYTIQSDMIYGLNTHEDDFSPGGAVGKVWYGTQA